MRKNKVQIVTLYFLLVMFLAPLAAVSSESPGCMVVQTIPGDPSGYFLNWRILPGVIEKESSETVAIRGKLPPFSWSVKGGDFELVEEKGAVNTLKAGKDACGAAEIEVTDGVGNSIIGYVRCKNGGWGNRTEGCVLGGGSSQEAPMSFAELDALAGLDAPAGKEKAHRRVVGKYRQTQVIWGPTAMQWGQCPQDSCNDFCDSSPRCNPAYGCDPCLWSEQTLPCVNSGYIKTSCPPSCRRWCYCTVEYYYEEWICNPE
jgi:hypothetical protein